MPTDTKRTEDGYWIVERIEDIPDFANEDEEHQFWSTHTFSEALMDQAKPIEEIDPELARMLAAERKRRDLERERTRPIAIRFDADTLKRLRALASAKGTGYQTLLKTFVMERLYEEEKREGLLERKPASAGRRRARARAG
jgi:uncharacterized protein (DUF4415 family)